MAAVGSTSLLLTFLACTDERPAQPPPSTAPDARTAGDAASQQRVLAEGRGVQVTVEDVEARIQAMPPTVRRVYERPEKKRQLVEELVRFQLLLAEARARGTGTKTETRPSDARQLVSQRVSEFMEEGFEQVPEAEARAWYDENRREFMRPAELRLEHLFFAAPEGSPERATTRRRALEALHQLRAASQRGEDLSARFSAGSADAGAAAAETIGFSTRTQLQARYSKAFADAVFQPVATGSILDLVTTPKGFHIVRRLDERGSMIEPFEAVREEIARKLRRKIRAREFDAHVAGLSKAAGVIYDSAAIQALRISGD